MSPGGPKSLRELVGAWKPSAEGSHAGDQASIIASWPEIVGHDVARRTRPFAFRDGTLSVLTASSEWSHHLTFLAPAIMERISAHAPHLAVKRLRFTVATGRTRMLLTASQPPAATIALGRRSAGPTARVGPLRAHEAADAEALLAALRAEQRELDRARLEWGWKRCASCGHFYEPGAGRSGTCGLCIEEARRGIDGRIARALLHDPWMRWTDLAGHIAGADERSYDRVRRRLLSQWEQHMRGAESRLRRGALESGDRITAWSYAMMLARKPQAHLRRAVLEHAMGRDWAQALLEAHKPASKKQRK